MWLATTVDTKRIYLIATWGCLWLGSTKLVGFFQRLIKHHGGNPDGLQFYQSEVDDISAALRAASASSSDTVSIAKGIADAIRADVTKAIGQLDVKAGASADEIADEIARRLVA